MIAVGICGLLVVPAATGLLQPLWLAQHEALTFHLLIPSTSSRAPSLSCGRHRPGRLYCGRPGGVRSRSHQAPFDGGERVGELPELRATVRLRRRLGRNESWSPPAERRRTATAARPTGPLRSGSRRGATTLHARCGEAILGEDLRHGQHLLRGYRTPSTSWPSRGMRRAPLTSGGSPGGDGARARGSRGRGRTPGLPPAGRTAAPLAVRLSCSNGSLRSRRRVPTRGVATRIAVGPPARAHRRDEPDASPRRRSCRPFAFEHRLAHRA